MKTKKIVFFRRSIRRLFDSSPALLLPCLKAFYGVSDVLVGPSTDLVIEGYPRSANTFAFGAFLKAQGTRSVRLAHHTHMPAHVIKTVRLAKPCLVLIREPEAAVLSYVLLHGGISIREALRDYIHFYKSIQPYNKGYVVADFRIVTTDFGSVIQKINQKFDTSFQTVVHDEALTASVFARIDKQNRNRYSGDVRLLSRPSSVKDELKQKLNKELLGRTNQRLLKKATKMYVQFLVGDKEN